MTTRMIYRNDLSPIVFYCTKELQQHRLPYFKGNKFPIYMPIGKIIPFQLQLPKSVNHSIKVEMYSIDDNFIKDISKEFMLNAIINKDYDEIDLLMNVGIFTMLGNYNITTFYLKIVDNGKEYYSDILLFTDVECMTKIEYYNQTDLTDVEGRLQVSYANMFKHIIYVDMPIGMPTYPMIEEGEEVDGRFTASYQISQKKFNAKCRLTEAQLDGFRIIPLHDVINIYDTMRKKVYRVNNMTIESKWVTPYLSKVNIDFMEQSEVKKVATLHLERGEFNNDFNEDFLITNR